MSSPLTVHVFSIIPKISETFIKTFPHLDIKTVVMKEDLMLKYGKSVREEEIDELKDAKILVTDGHLIPQMHSQLKNLEWIQCTWAGVEKVASCFTNGPQPTYPVTRMGGETFGQLMAEYTVGWILNNERAWLDARQFQLKSEFHHSGNIATYRSMSELTVGVMGVGLIGRTVAETLKFFKCRVHGLGRSKNCPDGILIDKYWSTESLAEFLSHCDYVVNILPSTPETRGLLGGDILKNAKPGCAFINIGRGDVISDTDVIDALDNGWISTAILDVFTEEPLPVTSRLWSHPKVVVTPHAAGVTRALDVATCFEANLKRFIEGLPLKNAVDWDRGY